jgi:hypothetical protein
VDAQGVCHFKFSAMEEYDREKIHLFVLKEQKKNRK